MINKNKVLILISIITLAFTLVSASFSWFLVSIGIDIDVEPYLEVSVKDELLVSLDGGHTWTGKYTSNTQFGNVLDVSGDGVHLYNPTEFTGDNSDQPIDFEDAFAMTIDQPNNGGHFLEFTAMFKSKSAISIYLGSDSTIGPVSEEERISSFGVYSMDFISGAARVAFLNTDKTESLMLWAPNPTYHLTYDGNGSSASFTKTGTPEATYKYIVFSNNSYKEQSVTKDDIYTRDYLVGSSNASPNNQGSSKCLLTLQKEDPSDEEFVGSLVVRIWIEGTDRESSVALSGGLVKINIVFIGTPKIVNATWENEINNISVNKELSDQADYTGLKMNTLARLDAGEAWFDYDANSLVSGTKYYVYYASNDSYLDSTVTYFTYVTP